MVRHFLSLEKAEKKNKTNCGISKAPAAPLFLSWRMGDIYVY